MTSARRLERSRSTIQPFPLASAHLPRVVRAANEVAPVLAARAADLDQDGAFPTAEIAMLHDAGLLTAPLPADAGGADLGIGDSGALALMDVLRALGRGSLAVGRIYEGHVNALLLVRRYGSVRQIQALAEAVTAGATSGVWNAEGAEHKTELHGGPGHLTLSGGKILASGAGHLTLPLVPTTNTDGNSRMVLVRAALDGRTDVSGWTAHGMRASATGTVDLSGIPVDEDDIVGAPGDYLRQPFFSGGAWRFCAVQLGAVEALVEAFRDGLVARRRDGDPIQCMRVAECAMAAETARLWVARAARIAAAEASLDADLDLTVAYVDLTRSAVERAAIEVLDRVQRGIGLQAFMRPHPVERIARDLRTYLRQPAPDAAMLGAAATLLQSDADPFRELP